MMLSYPNYARVESKLDSSGTDFNEFTYAPSFRRYTLCPMNQKIKSCCLDYYNLDTIISLGMKFERW